MALFGIIGIAYIVVALTPQEAASQPVAEASSPRGRDYIITRIWDLLENLQQAHEDDAEGVGYPSSTQPMMGRTLR